MVQGIGTTAYESLAVAAVGDMFFLHQRGVRTALLVLTLACLASFVAIIAGTGFQHLGADRKSTRLNSSHSGESRMPSSA